MNQILITKYNQKNYIKKMRLIFFIFFFISFILILFLIISKIELLKKEIYSNKLVNSYKITTLYNNYSSEYLTSKKISFKNNDTFVIGLIEIPKIELLYPILSKTTDDLLEISICHFYGSLPNQPGNMCIAGHNYSNGKMFGKLYLMDFDDSIYIYDNTGHKLEYIIYDILEVESDDISCLYQNTENKKEITLITCNPINNKRLIIKAKEKENR